MMHESSIPTKQRVVLLGASNVRMSLASAIATARSYLGTPLDVLVAAGHGRSYGQPTRVLARTLSGISECELWEHLDQSGAAATHALVTDIGNDLLYGSTPQQTIDWVRTCIDRLAEHGTEVVISRLPMASIESLSAARFRVFRRLLFPGNRMSLSDLRSRARELDDGLEELADGQRMQLVRPEHQWYGLDPIHPRFRHWDASYERFLAGWKREGNHDSPPGPRPSPPVSWGDHLRASLWTSSRRLVWGKVRSTAQPCARLRDETRVWMF
ncbi:MAG: hypothetical protein DWQ31_09210 [Planctomycetota bacterium]|nr:MAG: hypothetical protein DWQ31_09210 [Planctomycetota bacterium]REJ91370.1 MAG: hypothetical protein DWQ35_14555 [Planctomycetota bacterium]